MTNRSRILLLSTLVLIVGGAVLALVKSGSSTALAGDAPVQTAKSTMAAAPAAPAAPAVHTEGNPPGAGAALTEKPLASFQGQLLDIAFQAATVVPAMPHIKRRSRSQEAVVAACFELDQPKRALAYIEKIENWRRGAAYADLAYYCAEHDLQSAAPKYLELARQVSDDLEQKAQDEEEGRYDDEGVE